MSRQPSPNFPGRRIKETPRYFGFDLDRLAHGGVIFVLVRKPRRNGQKTSACLKKVLSNYALSWDLTFRKTKDFKILFPWRNKWPQHYIIFQMKVGCKKWQILLVWGNRQFRKLSDVFYFYFRKFFHCIYLTRQHNYFANIKSYGASLFIES